MNTGWVRIHRQIEDNDLWLKEPFTRGQAWIDLIIFANHKDDTIWIQGVEIEVKRGQIAWSELTMTKRWKWSRGKVRRFLKWLQKDGKTVQRVVQQKTTIITLVNYDRWQSDKQKTVQLTVQLTDNRRYTNKNDKNEKNIINTNVLSADAQRGNHSVNLILSEFERLWGFPPTDYKPRFVANNFKKNIEKFLKVFNPEVTEERFKKVLEAYLKWFTSQDYAENVQNLNTVRLKFKVWSTPQVTKYQKGKNANNATKE